MEDNCGPAIIAVFHHIIRLERRFVGVWILVTINAAIYMSAFFSRAHEHMLEEQQRIKIMVSQIQPHFLFNTLSTIQALCRIDPDKASEITGKFGTYLRRNIDSLETADLVPALTIQPMVENAIRHGVRIRENGVISVRTARRLRYHEIIIEDNGIGFEKKKITDDKGSHIGISNVSERIERMCGGTVDINSTVEEGTTVLIRIPFDAAVRDKSIMTYES